jgi:hypothetical protein
MLLGGVAEIDHEAATPRQQAWMAFAGPLVSLILGVGSLALSLVDGLLLDLRAALYIFGGMNLALAIFNLIPAYPLDGGRILRALLAARLQPMRATRISASVGRVLALCGVGFALMLPDPMLLLVSVFVFLGASADEAATTMRLGLAGLRARQAMARRVASVEPSRSLSSVARHMLFQGASAAIVRDAQSVRGVLGVRDVPARAPAPRRRGPRGRARVGPRRRRSVRRRGAHPEVETERRHRRRRHEHHHRRRHVRRPRPRGGPARRRRRPGRHPPDPDGARAAGCAALIAFFRVS